MTIDNQRELAQLAQRDEGETKTETALMVCEVVGRDHEGRVSQFRGMREATEKDLLAAERGYTAAEWEEALDESSRLFAELKELRAWKAEALAFPPEEEGVVPRPFLMEAARSLEETLRRNDDKPDWNSDDFLFCQLYEERKEVDLELSDMANYDDLRSELLDEAAVCLMLWARFGGSITINRGRDLTPPPSV